MLKASFKILVFYIILPLMVVELLLRLFNPIYFCSTVFQFRYDKDVGVTTRPNLNKSILTDHVIEALTNDIGSRNYLNKAELNSYKKLIFCVGDSYTEGIGGLTDQSYTFYLDLLLNNKSGIYEKNFAVVNLGLGGYGSIQSELTVLQYVRIFGRVPDAIIYFVANNDCGDDASYELGFFHRFVVLGSPYYNRITIMINELLENTQVWRRFKLLISPTVHKNFSPAESDEICSPENLSGLKALIKFARDNNIKLIISHTGYTGVGYDLFKSFAKENKIPFADYKPDVISISTANPRLPVFNSHSGGHYRSWVYYIVAGKFAEFFKDN
ncbi:MAG: SGNH/GDSL hydrolase family protein [Candidatus Omnitrophota bacterium]|jgi:hypothetical protein